MKSQLQARGAVLEREEYCFIPTPLEVNSILGLLSVWVGEQKEDKLKFCLFFERKSEIFLTDKIVN